MIFMATFIQQQVPKRGWRQVENSAKTQRGKEFRQIKAIFTCPHGVMNDG